MLTTHKIKVLQSLDKKKFRQKYNLFLVEGNKIIRELENSDFEVQEIFSTNSQEISLKHTPIHTIEERELKKLSFLQHPKDSVAVEQIICSEDTVDFYNPKVIQASMGSFARVNLYYTDLISFLETSKIPVLGTDMEGENLYKTQFPEYFYLILGNEGNGIRPNVKKLISKNISIPRFGTQQSTESLNVSMATGIILGHIFSQQ
jgi:TrmH family RNA methyltransferase